MTPFVRAGARLVDLGAGTGRFSSLFARSFDANIIGIEPSMAMLAATRGDAGLPNLAYLAASAERLPLRSRSCDLVWLSHVWHHLPDHDACARELRRVLVPSGHVLVRGTFGNRLDGFQTLFRFWPATRAICAQLPTIHQTLEVFEANGFVVTEHRCVQQITSPNLRSFSERTRLRADTALALISDVEFQEGQAAIEVAAAQEQAPSPVIEGIELLVFRATANAA